MACCGNGRQNHAPVRPSAAPPTFEYTGSRPFTIFGGVTGMRYHFPGPGARVAVDPRDARLLEVVEGLQVLGADAGQGPPRGPASR